MQIKSNFMLLKLFYILLDYMKFFKHFKQAELSARVIFRD